jgi:hypothetical protein
MIRKKENKLREIVIDLTGPDGNAFVLMGYATQFAKQLGRSQTEIDLLIKEMTSSDYENLLQVFDREFGDFIILER